jgi:regulator of sigma E protease
VNILLAILLVAVAYLIGAPGKVSRTVNRVEPNTPAASIGLQPGDKIIAVNGRPAATFDAISKRIKSSDGKPISVTIVRSGDVMTLGPVRPKKSGDRWILGFEPGWEELQYGLGGALGHSFADNWDATKSIVTFLPRLVTGEGRKEVSSPVGIVDYSSRAVKLNFPLYLIILGLISLSLAILNLLPLLPLDGGHILFSLIEGVRGRAVGREVYERVSAIGIALFLVLMFIGLSNDINRLGGG